MDLFACRMKDDDLDVDNLSDVFMVTTMVNVKLGRDIFPNI